jgi:hypothetical protein
MAGKRVLPTSGPPWDDNPRAFRIGLESTAEGCRWLRDRWAELGRMLRRGDMWTFTDLYRSIRLQGKHPVHAINDPDLNAQFLAWEVLEPTGGTDFWARCYQLTPRYDPGFSGFMEWREIVDRPGSEDEALELLAGVIDEHIASLEERIALHEEAASTEAFERADAASFDAGPEGEAMRRRRTALGRELRQMIELIVKMQAAREKRASREGGPPVGRGAGASRAGGRVVEDVAVQGRSPAGARPRDGDGEGPGDGRTAATIEANGAPPGRAAAGRARRPRRGKREPFVLPGALEMIVASGLADEVRALVRQMGEAQPDLPASASRGPARATNGPRPINAEDFSRKKDKPQDQGTAGGDQSQSCGHKGAT